jgi:hypothetical protein
MALLPLSVSLFLLVFLCKALIENTLKSAGKKMDWTDLT